MGGLVIETRGLQKAFTSRKGKRVAVRDLDLKVPIGGVHGFLRPNGSGKTTTIRMLLGLVREDSGTMPLFDRPVPQGLPEVLGRVRALRCEPACFPSFTGVQNLCALDGGPGGRATRVAG